MKNDFGGAWTEEKLDRVRKYLKPYTIIMRKQALCHKKPLRFAYIDAFAGTGYRTLKESENSSELMFPEMVESEVQDFLDGSGRVALEVEPQFDKYIFIEKDKHRFSELQKLKDDYPCLRDRIELVQADGNTHVQKLCRYNWLSTRRRAVLFLDPYGMEIKWQTIEAIANTKAIDLWLLFPLGVAVNRLLRRDGQIDESIRKTLDQFFGNGDWFNEFYKESEEPSLFENSSQLRKVADWDAIEHYFIGRLESVFSGVARNPLRLYNSRGNPLYLLCFAAGNSKGAPTAVKIVEDILKK